MAKKRISRSRKRELAQPDEFVSFTTRLIDFGTTYQKQLISGLVALVVVILAVSGYNYYRMHQEDSAAVMLISIRENLEQVFQQNNPDEKMVEERLKALDQDFEKLLADYGNTEAANMARAWYADLCFKQKNYDKAIELYSTLLKTYKGEPQLDNMMYNGLAHAYQAKPDLQSAATYYEKIAAGTEPLLKDEALYNLGLIYDSMGQPEKSKTAFGKLVAEFPTFPYLDIVKQRLAG